MANAHRKHRNRAQSALELLMLTGFMFLIFIATLGLGSYHLTGVQKESQQSLIVELADFLDNEIGIAVGAEEGYSRQFDLPTHLSGQPYQILVKPQSNFTEIIVKTVNTSDNMERSIVASSNVTGYVDVDPAKPTVTIMIKKKGIAVTVSGT